MVPPASQRRQYDRRPDRGFTLIELLVVVSIIAILAAMVLPAIKLVSDSAKALRCRSNLRQIGIAMLGYANDNDSLLQPVKWDRPVLGLTNWTSLISPYAEADRDANRNGDLGWGDVNSGNASVFKGCPLYKPASYDPQLGYGMSVFLLSGAKANWCNSPQADGSPFYGSSGVTDFPLQQLTYPTRRLLAGEVSGEFRLWGGPSMSYRHQNKRRATSLFCDFHVDALDPVAANLAFSSPQLGN